MKNCFIIFLSVLNLGCSSDNNTSTEEPSNPSSGQKVLSAVIDLSIPNPYGWSANHILIEREESGQWITIAHDGAANFQKANVASGDHIRIKYDNGIDEHQCCLKYFIMQANTTLETDAKCLTNTEPFVTFFDFTVE